MSYVLVVAISLHVLAAVFWAGSTAALARTGGSETKRLFRPQMGAAAVAILTGGYLWHTIHQGALGPMERSLMIGALSAFAALIVQVAVVASLVAIGLVLFALFCQLTGAVDIRRIVAGLRRRPA